MADLTPAPADRFTPEAAAHLLARAGFGGTWDESEKLSALGPDQAVNMLVDFAPSSGLPPPACAQPPAESDRAFHQRIKLLPAEEAQMERQLRRRAENEAIRELQLWWLNRMLASSPFHPMCRPLEEKLTLFWHSHFASGFSDKIERTRPLWQQNQMFRERAIGPFHELLNAVIRDPAMLVWLDNASNYRGKPNENFAREVMELFTMGIGHYSESDVQELARALTGYHVDRETWTFVFRPEAHDAGEKTLLGQQGPFDGSDAALILCEQPATATFLVRKFLTFFVCTDPDPALVDELARRYRAGGYDTRELLRTIFRSQMFFSDAALAAVIKSPVELAIGALKAMRAPMPKRDRILSALEIMGQRLFFPPDVNGWPGGLDWINSNTLLFRYNFSNFLVHGVNPEKFQSYDRTVEDVTRREFVEAQRDPDAVEWDPKKQIEDSGATRRIRVASDIVDYFLREFLQRPPPPELRDSLLDLAGTDAGGGRRIMSLRDRNFDERARSLVHMIMSSPAYQLSA